LIGIYVPDNRIRYVRQVIDHEFAKLSKNAAKAVAAETEARSINIDLTESKNDVNSSTGTVTVFGDATAIEAAKNGKSSKNQIDLTSDD